MRKTTPARDRDACLASLAGWQAGHAAALRSAVLEPRLAPGGKYEMATLVPGEDIPPGRATVVRPVAADVALNAAHRDPAALRG